MQNSISNDNGVKGTEVTFAGFLPRFIAFMIDMTLVSIASFIIKYIMLAGFSSVEMFSKPLLLSYSIVDMFTYIIKVSYFIVCVYCTQTTVGKYVMKLKVVNKDFEKLSLLAVIYRETIGRFLSSFLFVGYLLIFIQKDKAALHDVLVDSRVIYSCTIKKTVLVRKQFVDPYVNPYMQNQNYGYANNQYANYQGNMNYNNNGMTNQPPINTNQPPINTNQPPINTNQPPINTNQPPTDTNQLTIDTNQPGEISGQQKQDGNDPLYGGQ